jgi:hypothetical protein
MEEPMYLRLSTSHHLVSGLVTAFRLLFENPLECPVLWIVVRLEKI